MAEQLRTPAVQGTSGSEAGGVRAGAIDRARFLSKLLDALGESTSTTELASKIAEASIEVAGDWCAIWLCRHLTGEFEFAGACHRDPRKSPCVRRLAEGWPSPRHSRMQHELAGLTRVAVLSIRTEEQGRELLGSLHRARQSRRLGFASLLLAPLIAHSRRCGLLAIASEDPSALLDECLIRLVEEMARHVGTAIARLQSAEIARNTTQQLTLTSLHLQAVLDSIPQGLIVAVAPEGRLALSSGSLTRLLGRRANPCTPASKFPEIFGLATPSGAPYRPEDVPWVRTARTGEPVAAEEMTVRRPDGGCATTLCSSSPVHDEEGRTIGAVAVLQDITERKEIERLKDEFLMMVSHELKTPMSAIKGYAQLLHRFASREPRPQIDQAEGSILEAIDRQVSRMGRMVADLVDFSKIQLGRLELHPTTLSMGDLARDVVVQTQVAVPDRKLTVSVRGDATVAADPGRIEQVLANLISNAVKASPEDGTIHVDVRQSGRSVVTSVRDHGVGIPREDRARIFERLYRGHARYQEGLGLGLFISKSIICQHGGRVWFDSEEGKGSTFRFSLPAARGFERH